MTQVADRHETYVAAFETVKRRAVGLEPIREAAFQHFLDRGFPSTREEEWKFTSVKPIAEMAFEPAPRAGGDAVSGLVAAHGLKGNVIEIVMVNGVVAIAPSKVRLPHGVRIHGLHDAGPANGLLAGLTTIQTPPAGMSNPFVSLNTALFEDALIIQIEPHTILREPLHVLHLTLPGDRPALVAPRLLVVAGEHSQATVVETYAGSSRTAAFVNSVTEVMAGANAIVEHTKMQLEAPSTFHLASTFIQLARAATFASRSISFGGRISRNDINAVLGGEGAECTLNGLYVAVGESLVDTHTTIDHAQPHCPSHEVYKGILAGRTRAVFNGKIIVRPDAQKTDAKQTNKALLLTDDAQINTKPQLEIFADDVKCTHGAAIGQLDEDAMFYLRARGISEVDAKSLLIHAFAAEVLDGVKVDAVRARAFAVLEEHLAIAHQQDA